MTKLKWVKYDFKDDFGGPKSMKIYRWRFKNLSKF